MKEEMWKPIKGYEGLYEVSTYGRVRSLHRATTSGKILKLYVNASNGYVYVCLSKGNRKNQKRVHRCLMNAFYGEHPDKQVNHIDGDKTNNHIENLEWCSSSENMIHAYSHGLEKAEGRKVIDLTTNRVFNTLTEAAMSLGSGKASAISRVCNGMRSNYKNHKFAYLDDYKKGIVPEFHGKYARKSSKSLWR